MIKRKKLMPVLLIIASIVVSFGLTELVLRLVGFSFHLYPEKIEFGYPDPVTMDKYFFKDRDVLWVRSFYYHNLKHHIANNPQLALMGCSCTALGKFDEYLKEIIDELHPDNTFAYANLAASGWSSFQGLNQLKRDVLRIKPKVITIMYGWNDHWKGFGVQDKNVVQLNTTWLYQMRNLRLVQLYNKTHLAVIGGLGNAKFAQRVSLPDYQSNLTEMVKIARKNNIVPVLLTAATSHRKGKEPEYLKDRWLHDLNDLVPLHQSYVEAVREVARNENAHLIDLAKHFDGLPYEKVTREYFWSDGIHYHPAGGRLIAHLLYKYFQENNLLEKLIH